MAKLHSNIKKLVTKTDLIQVAHRKIVGEEKYDKTYDKFHPLGTQAVEAREAKKAAEQELADVQEEKVMPIADDEELTRAKRKALARRQSLGRSSTILGGASETLG